MSEDYRYLRKNITPLLLEAAESNHASEKNLRLFEIGKIYGQGEYSSHVETNVLSLLHVSHGQKNVSSLGFFEIKV